MLNISRLKFNVGNDYVLIIAQNLPGDSGIKQASASPNKCECCLLNTSGGYITPSSWYDGQEDNQEDVIDNITLSDLATIISKAKEYATANPLTGG